MFLNPTTHIGMALFGEESWKESAVEAQLRILSADLLEATQRRTEYSRVSTVLKGETSKPDFAAWQRWLTQIVPREVLRVDIKVKAVFKAFYYLLFTVPVEIWTTLPPNGYY
ncbi:hypothetical protein AbraIFM66951_001809 [Aspergillus brasiliensis]|uniref:Uncharacterized protein n=1 Tax=Aspergillus brasiliensis TaxID=319629 RepID=A0A9W6DTL6_9EURO|nr:hypothetical protein AbraCBS73388_003537 [Aspergillus brasiliensis]GKZ49402.1 hypothetical protein AbraIFM66951_001809 [Aspergillus brasiliensis]